MAALPLILIVPAILMPLIVMAGPHARISVSEDVTAGERMTITGVGFGENQTIRFEWDGERVRWLTALETNSNGAFKATIRIPSRVAEGAYQLLAEVVRADDEDDRRTGGRRASVQISVAGGDGSVAGPDIPDPTRAPNPSPVPTPSAVPTTKPPIPTVAPTVAPITIPTTIPTAIPTVAPTAAPPVVPPPVGVAGYGAGTAGGTGGRVVRVTNLNDGGAGSLRAAVAGSGSRIVVFDVAGTIALNDDLLINSPFVTVDGSSAPGPVAITGAAVKVITHDVILRNLRMRPGDQVPNPADVDAVTLNGLSGEVYNVVLDHLTMIWGPDIGGLAVLGNVHDVTVQYSIMGEGLYSSSHPESGPHGHSMGASVFQLNPGTQWARRLTFHHNLFTTSDNRMPVVQGAECVDLVNNVIFNWGIKGLAGNPRGMNAVNNWFRSGPMTKSLLIYQWQEHSANRTPYADSVYLAGNVADGFASAVDAPNGVVRSSLACGGLSVNAETADAAYNTVLGAAGATLPVRDAVDQRIIGNVINRAGSFFNGAGFSGPNPYRP